VFFSRTGTTRLLAEAIARATHRDLEELRERRSRRGVIGWLRSGYEGTYHKAAEPLPLRHDLSAYDHPGAERPRAAPSPSPQDPAHFLRSIYARVSQAGDRTWPTTRILIATTAGKPRPNIRRYGLATQRRPRPDPDGKTTFAREFLVEDPPGTRTWNSKCLLLLGQCKTSPRASRDRFLS
jgi:hypothetical protein